MAKAKKKVPYRITLDFSEDSRKYFEKLLKMTGCNTKAEMFRLSLNITDFVANELSKGGTFLLETNGEKQIVIFPITVKKRKRA